MIEILVACAVIVILMGLLFLGGRAIINSQKKSNTRVALDNLKSMLSSREAEVGATTTKSEFDALFNAITTNNTVPMNAPAGDLSNRPPAPPPPKDTTLPRVPRVDNHVGRTQNVITLLTRIQANKKAIQNLPSGMLLEGSTLQHGETTATQDHTVGAVVLDGWDIPILAVPSIGVQIAHEVGGVRTIRAKDGKPFFMSAGPDGFFSLNASGQPAGDDNLYSFPE
jgi:type II secretory pathway pseudopilin PulG